MTALGILIVLAASAGWLCGGVGGAAVAAAGQGAGMSPSDILRRAAKVLREHAESATNGRWTHFARNIIDTPVIDVDEANWGGENLTGYRLVAYGDDGAWRVADARYIALVDPTVGLALADWLDNCADRLPYSDRHTPEQAHALVVARAVLREDERHDAR